MVLTSLTNNYESAYFAYKNTFMGEPEWARIERSACAAMGAIRNSPFAEDIFVRLTEEYKTYLESAC